MKEFHLLNLGKYNTTWWEYKNRRYLNTCGSGFTPNNLDQEKILDKCTVNDWDDLDYSKTDLVLPDVLEPRCGWVDRNGKHYQCCYTNHDDYIQLIIKREVKDVEKEGWIRIWYNNVYCICNEKMRMSAEQRNTMSRLGFNLEDWE